MSVDFFFLNALSYVQPVPQSLRRNIDLSFIIVSPHVLTEAFTLTFSTVTLDGSQMYTIESKGRLTSIPSFDNST